MADEQERKQAFHHGPNDPYVFVELGGGIDSHIIDTIEFEVFGSTCLLTCIFRTSCTS